MIYSYVFYQLLLRYGQLDLAEIMWYFTIFQTIYFFGEVFLAITKKS